MMKDKKRDNMLQGKRILTEMLRLERNLENEKKQFLSAHQYTIPQIFHLFGECTTQRLTIISMMQGLLRFGMIQQIDAELLIARYDYDRDGSLNFWEFSNIFLPVNDMLKRDVLQRPKAQLAVSQYGHDLIRRYLNSVVNLEHIHKMRRETQFSGFSAKDMFESMDT